MIEEMTAGNLGKQIYKKELSKFSRFLFILICIIFFGFGTAFNSDSFGPAPDTVIALSLHGFGMICLLSYIYLKNYSFAFFEKGVLEASIFKSTEMLYEQMESFSWTATANYYNGIYTGTTLSVVLYPLSSQAKKLKLSTSIKKKNDTAEQVREFLSVLFSERLLNELKSGKSIEWGKHARLDATHLHYKPAGFIGRKGESSVKYDEIAGIDIVDGFFHLFLPNAKKSVFSMPVAEKNFFPGLLAFEVACSTQEQ